MMTKAEYEQYRIPVQRVLTGADIHRINTQLGHMIMAILISGYDHIKNDPDKVKYYDDMFNRAKRQVDDFMIEYGKNKLKGSIV